MTRRSTRKQRMTYRRHAVPPIDVDVVKRAVSLLFGILFLVGAYFAWTSLTSPDTLPFHHVKLMTNSHHVSVKELQNVVASNLEGGFFSLNSQKLRDAILQMPWVEDVALRIIWPDVLEVDVIEQEPLARWNGVELINTAGNIFDPPKSTFPDHLPALQGSDEDLDTLIDHFQVFNKSLSTIGLSVKRLQVDSRHAWHAVLSNGIEVNVGREEISQRFSRFVRLYPSLIGGHAGQVASVDLRYPNGFTIDWKEKPKWLHTES